jgi:hypothetical protein
MSTTLPCSAGTPAMSANTLLDELVKVFSIDVSAGRRPFLDAELNGFKRHTCK